MPIPAPQKAAERLLRLGHPYKGGKHQKPACARLTGFQGHPRRLDPNAPLLPVPLPLTLWRGSSAARETRRAHRARAGTDLPPARPVRAAIHGQIASRFAASGFPRTPFLISALRARVHTRSARRPGGSTGKVGPLASPPFGRLAALVPCGLPGRQKWGGAPLPKIIEKSRKNL